MQGSNEMHVLHEKAQEHKAQGEVAGPIHTGLVFCPHRDVAG